MNKWGELIPDLITMIARRILLIEDFWAFRYVCSLWRSSTSDSDFLRLSKVPLLVLPAKERPEVSELHSFWKPNTFKSIYVPEFVNAVCCREVGFGWTLTVSQKDGAFTLLKPFKSSSRIQVPKMLNKKPYEFGFDLGPAILSADPSEKEGFVLIISVDTNLCFWKYGEEVWNYREMPPFNHLCFHNKLLYGIDDGSTVWQLDPLQETLPQRILTLFCEWQRLMETTLLIESTKGELYCIIRRERRRSEPVGKFFSVLKIDVAQRTYRLVDGLEDSVFVGPYSASAILANDYKGVLEPNSVYYIAGGDDYDHRISTITNSMGIYNFKTRSNQNFVVNFEERMKKCVVFWVFPSL